MTASYIAAIQDTPDEHRSLNDQIILALVAEMDGLVEQFEALRAAAEVVAGSPFGAEVRGLPELRVLLASNPANVQGAPSPANGDAETSGTSGRPAPSPASKPYCTCPEGADGNPCAVCGKPEAVEVSNSDSIPKRRE